MSSLDAMHELAVDIALEAGALARKRREEGVAVAATKSSLADIVTEADREVEALIRSRLERERPRDGFLGEESGTADGSSGVTWVVDPIDGTVNYAYGIPAYAISIAAVEGELDPLSWRSLVGVVHNPATHETFHAKAGEGAFLGDRRLEVTQEWPDAGAMIATGFSYDAERRAEQFAILSQVMPIARDVRRIGAASLDLAFVAAGRVDAYYERGLKPWDLAAGALLVREAGGLVGGLEGEDAAGGMLIAAGPATFERLLEVLASVRT